MNLFGLVLNINARITRDEERVFRDLFNIIDYGKQGFATPSEIIGVLKAFSIALGNYVKTT